jgi:hypothetical protein
MCAVRFLRLLYQRKGFALGGGRINYFKSRVGKRRGTCFIQLKLNSVNFLVVGKNILFYVVKQVARANEILTSFFFLWKLY